MKRLVILGVVLLILFIGGVLLISLATNANRAGQEARDQFSTAEAIVQLTLTAHASP